MALTPMGARLECASSPCAVTRKPSLPLCAVTACIERRLADDAKPRLHRRILQHVEQPPDAHAADLLVIGEGKVDGRLQPRLRGLFRDMRGSRR